MLVVFKPVTESAQKYGNGIRLFFVDRRESEELLRDLEEAQSELSKNLVDQAKIKILEEENNLLRESLGFLSRNELSYVMVDVLSRGGVGASLGRLETIIINKGKKDGLKDGLALVNAEGLVVGKISEAKDSISEVLLSNNDNCKLAATILGSEKTSGITHGELGLIIRMEFIPQSTDIKEGDIVITSGLESDIPRGLVLGKITSVEKENNELWQSASIDPQFDHENLNMLAVVLVE